MFEVNFYLKYYKFWLSIFHSSSTTWSKFLPAFSLFHIGNQLLSSQDIITIYIDHIPISGSQAGLVDTNALYLSVNQPLHSSSSGETAGTDWEKFRHQLELSAFAFSPSSHDLQLSLDIQLLTETVTKSITQESVILSKTNDISRPPLRPIILHLIREETWIYTLFQITSDLNLKTQWNLFNVLVRLWVNQRNKEEVERSLDYKYQNENSLRLYVTHPKEEAEEFATTLRAAYSFSHIDSMSLSTLLPTTSLHLTIPHIPTSHHPQRYHIEVDHLRSKS